MFKVDRGLFRYILISGIPLPHVLMENLAVVQ
jgi:hypothetical protein